MSTETDSAVFFRQLESVACHIHGISNPVKRTRELFTELRELRRDKERMEQAKRLLILCFNYLGKDIEQLTLNQSAAKGTQTLRGAIAVLLDEIIVHREKGPDA